MGLTGLGNSLEFPPTTSLPRGIFVVGISNPHPLARMGVPFLCGHDSWICFSGSGVDTLTRVSTSRVELYFLYSLYSM